MTMTQEEDRYYESAHVLSASRQLKCLTYLYDINSFELQTKTPKIGSSKGFKLNRPTQYEVGWIKKLYKNITYPRQEKLSYRTSRA